MYLRKFYPLLLVIVLIVLGMIVQYLPSVAAESHIADTCETFLWEEVYRGYKGRPEDGFTDAVMLSISRSKPEDAGWKRFISSPVYSYFDDKGEKENAEIWDRLYPVQTLCLPQEHFHAYYFRYWHGYQTIMRPLLSFTDYDGMRKINKYLQPFLFAVLIYLFCRRKAYGLILGWLLSYLILNPEAMPYSIAYSVIYYISVISSIILLSCKEKIEQHIGWPIFFMMIGITTNYFDFLTYPIVSLAVPLTILFYLEPAKNYDEMHKKLFVFGGCWVFGYAGMWILKWLLVYMFVDENIFRDVLNAINIRTEARFLGNQYPFWASITETFKQLCWQPDTVIVIVAVCLLSIMAVLYKIKPCIKFAQRYDYKLMSFILISLGIFAYCLIVQGHPLQHKYYTYRLWVAFFFPIISMLNFWVLQASKKRTVKRKAVAKQIVKKQGRRK